MPWHLEQNHLPDLLPEIQGMTVMVQQSVVFFTTLDNRPAIPFGALLAVDPQRRADRADHGRNAPVANLANRPSNLRLDLHMLVHPVESPLEDEFPPEIRVLLRDPDVGSDPLDHDLVRPVDQGRERDQERGRRMTHVQNLP
jgi:hypothetical protein